MTNSTKPKGIVLYSGGLDSLLAARLLMEQDIDLTGLMFLLPFEDPEKDLGKGLKAQYAERINLKMRYHRCGMDYVKMIANPGHGYGKNMNPCIDCKIYFLKKAKLLMEEMDARFVATGEVIGQRPMSQMKHMLNHIEKESGLKGYLLRPLSAKLLKPTIAELEGVVNREKLMAITGRSRKMQIHLAEKFGIMEYSSPAGGCLLTDKNISRRLSDLMNHVKDYDLVDVFLLTIGRHYRLNESVRIIVGRNEHENKILEKYRSKFDLIMTPVFSGPTLGVSGLPRESEILLFCSIINRYGKNESGKTIIVSENMGKEQHIFCNETISDKELDRMRI